MSTLTDLEYWKSLAVDRGVQLAVAQVENDQLKETQREAFAVNADCNKTLAAREAVIQQMLRLNGEALEIFCSFPEATQGELDIVEWYSASMACLPEQPTTEVLDAYTKPLKDAIVLATPVMEAHAGPTRLADFRSKIK